MAPTSTEYRTPNQEYRVMATNRTHSTPHHGTRRFCTAAACTSSCAQCQPRPLYMPGQQPPTSGTQLARHRQWPLPKYHGRPVLDKVQLAQLQRLLDWVDTVGEASQQSPDAWGYVWQGVVDHIQAQQPLPAHLFGLNHQLEAQCRAEVAALLVVLEQCPTMAAMLEQYLDQATGRFQHCAEHGCLDYCAARAVLEAPTPW